MPPHITYTYGPSGICPVQAEGHIDGFPFYFKARGNSLLLCVARSPIHDALDENAWSYQEPYPDTDPDDLKTRFAAGSTEPEVCREFIMRGARHRASEQEAQIPQTVRLEPSLLSSLREIAKRENFPAIRALLTPSSDTSEGELTINRMQAELLVKFSKYLQDQSHLKSINTDGSTPNQDQAELAGHLIFKMDYHFLLGICL